MRVKYALCPTHPIKAYQECTKSCSVLLLKHKRPLQARLLGTSSTSSLGGSNGDWGQAWSDSGFTSCRCSQWDRPVHDDMGIVSLYSGPLDGCIL